MTRIHPPITGAHSAASPSSITNGKNPFKDERVRRAISLAIDRPAIVSRVMGNFAMPAEQLIPKEFFGAHPTLPALAYDPEQAKKLLAEAGYPNGFEVTLAGPERSLHQRRAGDAGNRANARS